MGGQGEQGGETLHRQALAGRIARQLGITMAQADETVAATFDAIAAELDAGHSVTIRGFGTFEARRMQPRTRRKPDTGEIIEVPARVKPAFRSGETLRRRLNRR